MAARRINIDIHQHYVPDAYFDAVTRSPGEYGASLDGDFLVLGSGLRFKWSREQRDLSLRLRDMDKGRIDRAVLSILPPFFSYNEAPDRAQRICALFNDAIAEAARHPSGRFVAMGHVPLQDVPASIAEMEKRRFPAVQIGSNIQGRSLDDPELLPFFQAAERLGVFVFVHPTVANIIGADRLKNYYLRNFIGNVTETAVAIASVMFGGVLDACPKLNICFAHGGGSAPYIWGRWAHGQTVRKEARVKTTTPVDELKKRIFTDTLTHSAPALKYLIGELGPDNVLVGSDYPADMANNEQVRLVEGLGLDADAVGKVTGGSAARVLGLD